MDHTVTVLELLRESHGISRAELSRRSGLSPATISRAVARLRRDGLVAEGRPAATTAGRPPTIVELRPDAAFVVGIDAGGSQIRALLVDLDGRIHASAARPLPRTDSVTAIIAGLAETVGAVRVGAGRGRVLAAGAGISGIVDRSEGRVLLSPDLPSLTGTPMTRLLSKAIGLPVTVDNDDLLAAVGEAAIGAARGCADVVFLSIGFGLGAGVIVDGRPVRGSASAAGAIAFVGREPLEDRASGRVIPELYRRARARSQLTIVGDDETGRGTVDAREVFRRAARGDRAARRVVDDAVAALGDLAISTAALLNPDVIVLGGGLGGNEVQVAHPIDARLRAAVPFPPRLMVSELGENAVAHGAALSALSLAKQHLAGAPPGHPRLVPDPGRVGSLQLA